MSESNPGARRKRRRSVPLLWGSGLVASAVLVLGVNGTLSSWTQAIIDNSNNSAASAAAVALTETVVSQTNPGGGGSTQTAGTVCDTRTDTSGGNSVTCSTINKYGGIGNNTTANSNDAYGVPLGQGGSQTVVVKMANVGNASAPLVLTPGACSNQAYPGSTGVDTTTYNLCNEMQLSVTCALPSTYTGYSGTVGGFTGAQAIGTLAAGASTDCTFTVSLPSNASSGYASQYLTQDLNWTLGS